MEEMRAILDSLMGSDRNNVTSAPVRATFKDSGVCHSYLVDFCPHDLFPNTKSDLGPCPNKHSDSLREQFLCDPEYDYYRKKYEKEFLSTLHRLVEGVEERIRRGQQRILGPDEAQIEQDKQRKFDHMKDEIASLLQRAQEAGEKGNIAEAETYTRKVTEIRCDLDRMTNLTHEFLAISNQEKSLRVCPVCGAMQSLGDATSRFESHVSGKQHVGYERIRSTYATLKAKYRPEASGTTTDTGDTTASNTSEQLVSSVAANDSTTSKATKGATAGSKSPERSKPTKDRPSGAVLQEKPNRTSAGGHRSRYSSRSRERDWKTSSRVSSSRRGSYYRSSDEEDHRGHRRRYRSRSRNRHNYSRPARRPSSSRRYESFVSPGRRHHNSSISRSSTRKRRHSKHHSVSRSHDRDRSRRHQKTKSKSLSALSSRHEGKKQRTNSSNRSVAAVDSSPPQTAVSSNRSKNSSQQDAPRSGSSP